MKLYSIKNVLRTVNIYPIILIFICLLMIPRQSWGQYRYHSEITSIHGDCYGGGLGHLEGAILLKVIQAEIATGNNYIFQSEMDCISARNTYAGTHTAGGCTVVVASTPCTSIIPNNLTSGDNNNNVNSSGYTHGQSYYSSNPANEINDWDEQYAGLMKFIGNVEHDHKKIDFYYYKPLVEQVNDFISSNGGILGNMGRSGEVVVDYNEFMEMRKLLNGLHSIFYQQTGYDIEELLLKEPKEDIDLEIISKYMYWKQCISKEMMRLCTMALNSSIIYDDASSELIEYAKKVIGIREILSGDISEGHPLYRLSKLIEMSRNEQENQGFYAELTSNGQLDEFTVAFRGTESPQSETKIAVLNKLITCALDYYGQPSQILMNQVPIIEKNINSPFELVEQWVKDLAEGNMDKLPPDLHDIATDVSQGFGEILTQYKMVIEIADVIRQIMEENPNIKINITGHSLGGGEAILAGVVSDAPTYVFNPAGVHSNTFEYAEENVGLKSQGENIIRFSTDDDILTNTQESNGTMGALLNSVAKQTAEWVAYNQTGDKASAAKIAEKALPSAIGNKVVLHTGENHSIDPISHLTIKISTVVKQIAQMDETSPECRIYYDENK